MGLPSFVYTVKYAATLPGGCATAAIFLTLSPPPAPGAPAQPAADDAASRKSARAVRPRTPFVPLALSITAERMLHPISRPKARGSEARARRTPARRPGPAAAAR